jgi:sugar-specific transcriptional regulator TrmB
MTKDIKLIQNMGFSDKAAKVYLAALELGESTVQTLAKKSGLKRTTIYYVLTEEDLLSRRTPPLSTEACS